MAKLTQVRVGPTPSASERRCRFQIYNPPPSSLKQMPGRVFVLASLFFNRAVRALPRGNLDDLRLLAPELDEPIPFMDQTIHHMEQASTPPRIEHPTSVLSEPTTAYATRLTSPIIRSSSHFTPTSTSQLQTPAPGGIEKHPHVLKTSTSTSTSISISNSASVSQNTTISAWHPPPSSSPAELARGHTVDWHAIGIAVIVVSVVGTAILVIAFFDQWWGFLGDVCGRRQNGRRDGKEELVPDWERGSWEFKVEDNNVPTYPSFGSPPASRTQQGAAATHAQLRGGDMPVDQRSNHQGTLFDGLTFPPVPVFRENIGMQGTTSGYVSPGWCQNQKQPPLRNCAVNGVTPYRPYHTPSESDTQWYTSLEDAYDGLASE
jgi:hypothetical protein